MKNKDFAYDDFINMIVQSWTYELLTYVEKNRVIDALRHEFETGAIAGNYKHRFEVLHAIYYGFLLALDYNPCNWRE